MGKSTQTHARVVIIGNSPIAYGVCGLLLNSGHEPALVFPSLNSSTAGDCRPERRSERVTRTGWNKSAISYASLHDSLEALSEADWVFDASWFSLEEKRALFKYIEVARKPSCIVTTDESISTARDLAQGLGQRFTSHFAVTHFFLPVERLPLVEVVFGDSVTEDVRLFLTDLCADSLQRSVLLTPDSPGFIANRIGMYWAVMSAMEAIKSNIGFREADVAMCEEFGVPRSGVFGLIDMIGIDVFEKIVRKLQSSLEESDGIQKYRFEDYGHFKTLLRDGRTGRSTRAGFYRYDDRGKPEGQLSADLKTYEALPEPPHGDRSEFATLLTPISLFKRNVRFNVEIYVNQFCLSTGVRASEVRMAMRTGYGWNC
ncbi:3-hydroxyacyl-CoA dehydrogenase family protein [Paraburkholderia sp. SIMBA_030]|uniref:3-hydroxyacyl-CoA dehydrogenase family protein n=1 Tax=Paraburkholderia sp. SIMBA_030 TaxID=3085773 RepID=UPI00397DD4D0